MLPKILAAMTCVAIWSAATPAVTQPVESAVLTLNAPAPKDEFIIDGAYWTCEGVTCQSASVPSLPPVIACMHVVQETGAATSLTWRGRSLSGEDLAACNVRARKPR